MKNILKPFADQKKLHPDYPEMVLLLSLSGMMQRPSRLGVMEEGKVPCLWILGSMDSYIPCDLIQSKVKLPQNATVVVLEDSGHLGFIEEEDNSVDVITKFVKKLL